MARSKRALAVLVALGVVGWATTILAQQMPKPGGPGAPGIEQPGGAGAEKPAPPGAHMPGATGAKEVEGTIKKVDPSGKSLTLDNGTRLTIPPTVKVERGSLKEGAHVKASYEVKGGQNVVTMLEVKPEAKSPTEGKMPEKAPGGAGGARGGKY